MFFSERFHFCWNTTEAASQKDIISEKHMIKIPLQQRNGTLPETNIAPENGWLEYYFPIGEAYFQGLC